MPVTTEARGKTTAATRNRDAATVALPLSISTSRCRRPKRPAEAVAGGRALSGRGGAGRRKEVSAKLRSWGPEATDESSKANGGGVCVCVCIRGVCLERLGDTFDLPFRYELTPAYRGPI